jgi:hypothetical protein
LQVTCEYTGLQQLTLTLHSTIVQTLRQQVTGHWMVSQQGTHTFFSRTGRSQQHSQHGSQQS